MPATASFHDVTKRYGRTEALAPTSLDLHPGVIGLLGPNGAGKSTFLALLATAMPPSAGRIIVAGHDVTGSPAQRTEARRRIGYLPQEVGFPRNTTAFGFLDYLAVLKEWRDTRRRHDEIRRCLDLVNLGERGRVKVSRLSGGERRRLALAQALIGSPEVLVLDEPTTGLDPEQRASLRNLISGLAGTVLVATHQTEDVSALCDRVLVIDAGVVRFDGSVEALLATARSRVHVGPAPMAGALVSWRTGAGMVRSVGGTAVSGSSEVEPTVEDAYLLLRDPAGLAHPEGAPS